MNNKKSFMPRIESINILRILGALLITTYHMDFQAASIQNLFFWEWEILA